MEVKKCTKCGVEKPATAEYFHRGKGAYGLRGDCKVCVSKRKRAYDDANRERRAEYQREWREVNKEHVARYEQTRRLVTKGRAAEYSRMRYVANKALRQEQFRKWYEANKERAAERRARRRASIRNAEGSHTAADIKAQYERQKGKCHWCGVKVGDTYHVDHVIPLSRGGSNDPSNLVIACPSCNLSKQDKLPHEWIQGGRLI